MYLTCHYATNGRLDACARIVRDRAAYDHCTRARLVRMWGEMLTDRSATAMVVEDEDRPAGAQVVGCGLIVFVTDDYAHEMKTALPPYLGLQILRRREEGRSPVLDLAAVRRANAGGGLNLVVLHSGWDDAEQQVSRPETLPYQQKIWELLPAGCSGYRVKEAFLEQYGDWQLETALAAGFSLVTDYPGFPLPAGTPRVTLTHATRAGYTVGSAVGGLFTYAPPCFHFKTGEQDVLREALLGADEAQITRQLCVSPAAVRKRWLGIYERVSQVRPEFFPYSPGDGEGARGAEKRRRLLAYLRAHPEELRPSLSPK